MNTVQLIGRLTDDPKADTTPTGKSVCRMRLAVPGFNRDATPVFIDIETWNKLAEACDQHLDKGRRDSVTGRIANAPSDSDGPKRQRHAFGSSTGRARSKRQREKRGRPANHTGRP